MALKSNQLCDCAGLRGLRPPRGLRSTFRVPKRGISPVRCLHAVTESVSKERLLDTFWEARGVFEVTKRQQLVRIAKELGRSSSGTSSSSSGSSSSGPQAPGAPSSTFGSGAEAYEQHDSDVTAMALPGVPATWARAASVPEISEVSRRLLELHALLGGKDDVDVVWMVVREPRLLQMETPVLMQALMAMKLMTLDGGGGSVDIVKLVESQPSLLLAPPEAWAADGDSLQERLQAWQFGLASDADPEWAKRLEQLRAYHRRHGDCGVGFREGDDDGLTRWATKQRSAARNGALPEVKREVLEELGFEFDADDAEWLRWFLELARFKELQGHASPAPLAAGADMYLINWCSVQRVAYRCKVLSQRRLGLLNSLEFDWSGADPLS